MNNLEQVVGAVQRKIEVLEIYNRSLAARPIGGGTTITGTPPFSVTSGVGKLAIPSFSARKTTNQTINSFNAGASWQLVTWNAEDFDVGNAFTSSRHTPTIPGVYMYTFSFVYVADPSITSGRAFYVALFKNGAEVTEKSVVSNGTANNVCMDGAAFIAMNGTTDYMELFTGHYDTASRYIAGNFTAVFAGAWVGPLS